MKKIKFLSIFLILFVGMFFVIQSCQKNEITEINNELITPEMVGKIHNESLDYVIKGIKSFKKNNKSTYNELTFEEKLDLTEQLSIEYSLEMFPDLNSETINELYTFSNIDKETILETYSNNTSFVDLEEISSLLPENKREYIMQLIDLSAHYYTYEYVLEKSNIILNTAKENLTTEELEVIEMTQYVLLNSVKYWNSTDTKNLKATKGMHPAAFADVSTAVISFCVGSFLATPIGGLTSACIAAPHASAAAALNNAL